MGENVVIESYKCDFVNPADKKIKGMIDVGTKEVSFRSTGRFGKAEEHNHSFSYDEISFIEMQEKVRFGATLYIQTGDTVFRYVSSLFIIRQVHKMLKSKTEMRDNQ